MRTINYLIFLIFFFGFSNVTANPIYKWRTLPDTPMLPKTQCSGYAHVNGIKLWYAVFGKGKPVVLLHGGLANSNYWGYLVPALAKHYQVIVIDSRGQGRSTSNGQVLSYNLMASDVLELMDFLKIKKFALIGWSDGANTGLNIAIHHPERLTKLFFFAGNSNPNANKDDAFNSPVIKAYIKRTKEEYLAISPTPTEQAYEALFKNITTMWAREPRFTKSQLHSITIPVWVVDGDHDEGIKRENIEYIAETIPNAGLLIEPNVSHFAFLQDPQQFNMNVLHFLKHTPDY